METKTFDLFVLSAITIVIILIVSYFALLNSYEQAIEQTEIQIDKAIHKQEQENQKQKEEVLRKGETISALVIDKKIVTSDDGGDITTTPFVVGNTILMMNTTGSSYTSSDYYLKIYADQKNYDIVVPQNLYNKKSIGQYLMVKILKDKIELLDN